LGAEPLQGPRADVETRVRKAILGLLIGAGIGAAVGYSQILCFGGQCALTGSWYGGALLGGMLGTVFTGGVG
jgi:hypothetical protein